ncbi:GRB2-associated-binding protein 1 [Macrobrachium rosenbergii]|uniref:GRB2-associated-binding protein 1 n=1 Tax=Macrobrachium rosenbergii TaxID=79674 RepID=UPI0034D59DB9
MVHGSMEIVHEGFLEKSPPPKRLWRAKWRRRWFVLRSGELPGQYFLEYYTDKTCRKLKGKIDLDQCDQVDAGLTFANRKSEYKFMFDIKTPKRIYYLCAETEQEMNRWVDCVCQVCGLKVYSQDDEYPIPSLEHLPAASNPLPATPPAPLHGLPSDHHVQLDSPPLSPSSISGPYIPISECITGKRTPITGSNFPFTDDLNLPLHGSTESHRSSIPNEMAPAAPVLCPDSQLPSSSLAPNASTGAIPREAYDIQRQFRPSGTTSEDTLSVQSPLGTEGSSVFSEDEWALTPPKAEAKFFSDNLRPVGGVSHTHRDPLPKDGQGGAVGGPPVVSGVATLPSEVRGLTLSDDQQQQQQGAPPCIAPPRPPKPPHLTENPQQLYQNLETIVKTNLVRRNSSNDKVKNGTGIHLASYDTAIGVSDPEPSPASVSSSVPPTPSDLVDEAQVLVVRSQQHAEAISPQAAERSKQRICHNNFTAVPVQNQFFSYDMRAHDIHDKQGEFDPRISPAGLYSNIPQANISPIHPPAIDRGLKPRKVADGGNLSSSEMSPPPSAGGPSKDTLGAVGGSPLPPRSAPPAVDRNLKPMKIPSDQPVIKNIVLDPAPLRYKKHDQRIRAAPSPTPTSLGNGRVNNESGDEPERTSNPSSRRNSTQDEQIFFPLPTRSQHEIQYTDLDLEMENRHSPKPLKPGMKNSAMSSVPSVVYKTIDFVKTEVFNEMKKTVEDTYRKNQ